MNKFSKAEFDPIGFILLFCGIIFLLVGIFQYVTDTPATGISMPGRSGMGGGNRITVTGKFMIFMGASFFAGGILVSLVFGSGRKKKEKTGKSHRTSSKEFK